MKEIIRNYGFGDALLMIPALLLMGFILKELLIIPDKWIPLLLLPLGIAGALAMIGFSGEAIVQGILVTGAAVYIHQVYKQLLKKF